MKTGPGKHLLLIAAAAVFSILSLFTVARGGPVKQYPYPSADPVYEIAGDSITLSGAFATATFGADTYRILFSAGQSFNGGIL